MPLLPFANCGNVEPPVHDCEWLFDTGQVVLATALGGLEPFIPPDACGEAFESYVSMGPPVPGFGEGLSVHLVSYGNHGEFKASDCEAGMFPRQAVLWQVQLWETCYPTIDQGGLPPKQTLDKVNEHVYAHGIAAYNAVVLGWASKTIHFPPQVTSMSVGPLFPLGPQATSVGWRFDVTTVIG